MTTENVTVLFTDMVGSTALASSLDVDDADELRRGHFAMLRQSVVEAGGTEVKSRGDGLMVVFGSASAALSCAVAMQQGIEREGRRRQLVLGLRVGLSAGEVSHEDDDYFGEPVIEAARLCDRCEGGQVLAADIVRMTAGRRSRYDSRPLGPLALKGLPDSVETVEVLWVPLGGDDAEPVVPLPARLAVRPRVGVVGRDAELTVVLNAFKRVAAGEGREVLLVTGEAGLGKTTVLAEAARVVFDEGACVLFGHCEQDLATPYQLFTEALGHLVTHARAEQLTAHVESWGPELAVLVPALASRLPGLEPSRMTDADTERYQVFAAVVGLLGTVSQAQPVVLVLDDLQWADRASLQLLQHLLAVDHPMRVLVLGTYRDAELSRAHPLTEALAGLHRRGEVGRLELAGLDDAGIVSLMEAAAGHVLGGPELRLARALHRETDGNPFFVSEVLRHLTETGAINQDPATERWVAATPIEAMALPASVRTIIGARVGRLGPEAERVLSLAAVVGRDFDLDVLAGAAVMAHDDVIDILEAATAVTLVRELGAGHHTFAHALIQHTLYEDLGATRQARAHRRVAEALEELCGDRPESRVGDLARHWHAAQPADPAKALDYSQRAGDAALAALAPGDALRHYTQALAVFEQSDDADPLLGIDLAIGIGTAQRQSGNAAFRETLLSAARRAADLGDTARLVAAALANNRGMFSNSATVDTERVAILELAHDRLGNDDPSRALVLSTLCAELTGDDSLERRQALADEALAIARSIGDDAITVRVLNLISWPLLMPHLLDQSLAWSAEGLEIAERLGDPVQLFWAAHTRAGVALCSGDIDETDRCYEIAWSVAERLDEPMLLWQRATMRALRAQLAGDNDAAEVLTTEAFRIATDSGQPDAAVFLAVQQGAVAAQRGIDAGDITAWFENLARQVPNQKPAITAGIAMNHVEMGRLDDAHRLLRAFAASGFAVPPNPGTWCVMVMYATVAVACRDAEIATAMFDRLRPFADQVPTNAIQAFDHTSLVLGELATVLRRYDDAEHYYARAAEFSERAGAKFLGAKTNLWWAAMLVERVAPGDTQRARDLFSAAHTMAAANGYARLQRQAADALGQLI